LPLQLRLPDALFVSLSLRGAIPAFSALSRCAYASELHTYEASGVPAFLLLLM